MLLIRTRVGPSPIHGSGVFACERVLPGTAVWRFDPTFDRVIAEAELPNMPAAFREYVDMYAYCSTDLGEGCLLLPCDHAKFLNHNTQPNTKSLPFMSIASRVIGTGDEITCDYESFCVGWKGFGEEVSLSPPHQVWKTLIEQDQLPHRNLYTRIKDSSSGVGLFAIRDIPLGTKLFIGDAGKTVRVPVSGVDRIADHAVRRMYIDFCPLVDEHFVAPSDFNQMTMSWYLNHSEAPNVAVIPDLQFVTTKFISAGEELTADYKTYSGHAVKYVSAWQNNES